MKDLMKILLSVVMVLVVVLFLIYGKTILSLDTSIDTDLISLMPGVTVVVVGFIMAAYTGGAFRFPSIAIVGVGFAILIGELDDLGMITATMLEGLTVAQLQLYCVVLGLLFGGVIGYLGSRE